MHTDQGVDTSVPKSDLHFLRRSYHFSGLMYLPLGPWARFSHGFGVHEIRCIHPNVLKKGRGDFAKEGGDGFSCFKIRERDRFAKQKGGSGKPHVAYRPQPTGLQTISIVKVCVLTGKRLALVYHKKRIEKDEKASHQVKDSGHFSVCAAVHVIIHIPRNGHRPIIETKPLVSGFFVSYKYPHFPPPLEAFLQVFCLPLQIWSFFVPLFIVWIFD